MLRVPFLFVNFLVVPMDSTQSFVDDLSSLSHRNPLGITVLIHFNYAPPVAIDLSICLPIDDSLSTPMFLLALLFLVTFCYIVSLCSRLIDSSQFLPYANFVIYWYICIALTLLFLVTKGQSYRKS